MSGAIESYSFNSPGSPVNADPAAEWVISSAADYRYSLTVPAGGDGVIFTQFFNGDYGHLQGLFENIDSDGFLLGQYDGSNGIAAEVVAGEIHLVVDGVRSTESFAASAGALNSISVGFSDSESALVVDGTVIAVAGAPTLPAQAPRFGAANGADGVQVGIVSCGAWEIFSAPTQVFKGQAPNDDAWEWLPLGKDDIGLKGEVAKGGVAPIIPLGGSYGYGEVVEGRFGPGSFARKFEWSAATQQFNTPWGVGDDWAFSIWANVPSDSRMLVNYAGLLWCYGDSSNQVALWFSRAGSIGQLTLVIKDNNVDTDIQCSANYTPDTWHHFALQKEGDTITVYLDGQPVATGSVAGQDFSAVQATLRMAYYVWSSQFAEMTAQDWVIYDSAQWPGGVAFDPENPAPSVGVSVGEVSEGGAAYPSLQAEGESVGISGYQLTGYHPVSDAPEYRAPVAGFPGQINTPNIAFPTLGEDHIAPTWLSRNMQVQGSLHMADVAAGGFSYSGPQSNIKARREGLKITGTVTDNTARPLSRMIRLYDRRSGQLVREQWSNTVGNYTFSDLEPGRLFTVVAHDYNGEYNAIVVDDVLPGEQD